MGTLTMARPISAESAVFDKHRLDRLRELSILDTPPEAQFDRLTGLATQLLNVPIALVTLVDDKRQFFKCSVGLPEPYSSQRETPLSHSFCQHVVDRAEPLVLDDARGHDVLRENLAIRDIGVVAYAGIPLKTSDRVTLGTFCAIDTQPRKWVDFEIQLLTVFAAAAMTAIELHLEREVACTSALQLEATLEELRRNQEELVASQRLEAVGHVAAGIAHDFNNLLAVIGGSVEMASDDLPADAAARECLADAADAIERGSRLVRQLLTFSHRERAVEPVIDVVDAITGLRPLLQNAVGRRVDVRLDLPQGSRGVAFDRTHFEQVLMNLAVNARNAMPDGGLLVIRVRDLAQGEDGPDSIEVEVSDTGTGMTPEVRARIFEPFFSTGATPSSSGLGLSTSLGLVERAGGTLSVDSAPGEGTTFAIRLPAEDQGKTRQGKA